MRDHLGQLLPALFVGRDLRAQISHVLIQVARRILGVCQQCAQLRLANLAAFEQLEIGDQYPFVVDRQRVRWHRAGRNAADIGVVAARTDVKQYLLVRRIEHRRNHGNVGQMRASGIRIVQYPGIARRHLTVIRVDDCLHTSAHRAQMYRHVRRVRN